MSTIKAKNSEICRILAEYAAFELEINNYSSQLWRPFCSVCKGVCCQPEYCWESIESPFLSRLHGCYSPKSVFSSDMGWLTGAGCSLPLGRPPVCYQFVCEKILETQGTDEQQYLMKVFSNLINHVGKRALGHRHLVAIMDSDQLDQLDYDRFARRLNEAKQAFELLQASWDQNAIDESALQVFAVIVPPPAAIYDSLR